MLSAESEGQVRGAVGIAVLLFGFGSAEAAPTTFFCAAGLANTSQVNQVQRGPTYRVRGTIRPGTMERIPDPTQPLRIVGNDIPNTLRVGEVGITNFAANNSVRLRLTPRYSGDEPETVIDVDLVVTIDGHDRNRALGTMASHGALFDPLPFEIDIREDRVIVQAGERREEFGVTIGRGATVEMFCAGGTFDFEDIEWDSG